MFDLIPPSDIIDKLKASKSKALFNVFRHHYTKPYSKPVERFILLSERFTKGTFLSLVNAMQIERYNASEAMFSHIQDKEAFIIATAEHYAETHPNDKMAIDEFMLNNSSSSPFLTTAMTVLQAHKITALKTTFDDEVYDLLDALMKIRGSYFVGYLNFADWYDANKERLQAINRGSWDISPFASKLEAIKEYLAYMVQHRLNNLYINSKDWFQFLDHMGERYLIQMDGTPVPITYTTEYEHKTVTTIDPWGWTK